MPMNINIEVKRPAEGAKVSKRVLHRRECVVMPADPQ